VVSEVRKLYPLAWKCLPRPRLLRGEGGRSPPRTLARHGLCSTPQAPLEAARSRRGPRFTPRTGAEPQSQGMSARL
jgi:hypothetical protein